MEMPHSLGLQQSIALPVKNVATTDAVETKEDKSLNRAANEVTRNISGFYRHKQDTQPRDKYEQHTCSMIATSAVKGDCKQRLDSSWWEDRTQALTCRW
eukprot:CAMPEP_0172933390 /NCGR_PEP_ID=MMETSP1075-20121228/220484_1 /TAXON_ID=2916 /ORGANISM="Ceratium fusus, Strain PA161109" /LENGTH=98 /DNA_ID=CAMNT_0013794733 /DNA_START=138 /DNA_END=431 /DNA_ORIENTATION=-